MRLKSFRVKTYRSVIDSGEVQVEDNKTIFVGPNEAGKSAILGALQQINAPTGVSGFDPLRDYPRRLYNDISTGKVDPKNVEIVTAHFTLSDEERAQMPEEWGALEYKYTRKLDNKATHEIVGAPTTPHYNSVKSDFSRLAVHADINAKKSEVAEGELPTEKLNALSIGDWSALSGATAKSLTAWLDSIEPYTDEGNATEQKRLSSLRAALNISEQREAALRIASRALPVFILYNNYLRVRPIIHLAKLAQRLAADTLDDEQYDYGNLCFLRLLGFDVGELSDLGDVANRSPDDADALEEFRKQLDERRYALNAAEVRLTEGIREVWNPDESKEEAAQLRIDADGQLLTVSVVDDLGVSVELDQRSEGFQWLVSFFIIFFAEAQDKHSNAILLLDEPGVSLHGLKQREFQKTVDRLSEDNQTIFTTHSPFMVGPDELDKVRVVEMANRKDGTKVHTTVTANDAAALLPLQEALGYDLAQSLFTQSRNLILEGLTDYWYVEATAALLRDAKVINLNQKISLIPAAGAGKVVYFATILHAQKLKVAALLDSDAAGDKAANQETLIHTLGNKNILRTSEFQDGTVKKCEVEDLLRNTLIGVAKEEFGTDVGKTAAAQPSRPLVDIMTEEIDSFSKYKLAKSFVKWSRDHSADDLSETERASWSALIERLNKSLK